LRDFHEQQKMKPVVLDNYKAACAAGLFRVFGDADRVRIVSAMLEQGMNISTLAEMVDMTESVVSHHLQVLRQMQLVGGPEWHFFSTLDS
jgi:ArsR family transcriptional regulator